MRKTMPGNTAGFEFAEDPDLDVNDITQEDILSAYRVMLPTHGLYYGVCKRNCRNNPRCLTGLGEKVSLVDSFIYLSFLKYLEKWTKNHSKILCSE